MTTYTPNLNLCKKDPVQDKNDTFNIDTMLNENWDKIDQSVEYLENQIKAQVNQQTTTLTNANPTEHITAKQNCGVDVKVGGDMVVNLLGRDGDCESLGKFDLYQLTEALDSSNKVFGDSGIKLTLTSTVGTYYKPISAFNVDITKYYILNAYLKNGNAQDAIIYKDITGGGVYKSTPLVTDITEFNRVGVKLQPSDFHESNVLVIQLQGIAGQYGYVDGIMLTEITQDEYNNLTVDQLLAKYPYTNSAQPLLNPTVEVCGKNLVKNGNGEEGTNYWLPSGNDNSVSIENNRFKLLTSATGNGVYVSTSLKKNTDYYISGNVTDCRLFINGELHKGNKVSVVNIYDSVNPGTFNSGEYDSWRVGFWIPTTGTGYADSIQLEQGTTPTPYEPYKGGQIIFPTELTKIDNYQDKLTYKDGVANVDREVKHVVLDGSLDWVFNNDHTGLKIVRLSRSIIKQEDIKNADVTLTVMQKYDGKIIPTKWQTDEPDTFYMWDESAGGDRGLVVAIADTDSGWGEDFEPNADEIKAYFNGWKMFEAGMSTQSLYNRTDGQNKAWTQIGYVDDVSRVTTILPINTSPSITEGTITHYQLYYALQQPIQETIQPIILGDGFNLVEGQNTVTVKSGVVWEKVKPAHETGIHRYYINIVNTHATITGSQLSNKVKSGFKIYKNGVDNTNNWTKESNTDSYGEEHAYIPEDDFDPQSTYYVLYEVLHEDYNCQVQEVEVSYEDNIRGAVNELVEATANNEKSISDLMEFILPMADKELAMSNIDLLTTESAEDNKAKINELINIWKG